MGLAVHNKTVGIRLLVDQVCNQVNTDIICLIETSQVSILRNVGKTCLADLLGLHLRDLYAVEINMALLDRKKTGQCLCKLTLTITVDTGNTEDLTFSDIKMSIINCTYERKLFNDMVH